MNKNEIIKKTQLTQQLISQTYNQINYFLNVIKYNNIKEINKRKILQFRDRGLSLVKFLIKILTLYKPTLVALVTNSIKLYDDDN